MLDFHGRIKPLLSLTKATNHGNCTWEIPVFESTAFYFQHSSNIVAIKIVVTINCGTFIKDLSCSFTLALAWTIKCSTVKIKNLHPCKSIKVNWTEKNGPLITSVTHL